MQWLLKGNSWILMVETYQTDKTLFDKTNIAITQDGYWMYVSSVETGRYVHQYQDTHMLYYHKQMVRFVNSDERGTVKPSFA